MTSTNTSPQKPVVALIGASGYIGKATINALSSLYGSEISIRVGVRNPQSAVAQEYASLPGVEVVNGDLGNVASLQSLFEGVHSAYIIAPGHIDRTQLTINGIDAAKAAGVSFALVLSVPVAEKPELIFGKQCSQIETAARSSGLRLTFLRLPMFVDNLFASLGSIKDSATIYGPVDPAARQTTIAVSDAGLAAATILRNPDAHVGKTYTLRNAAHTYSDIASAVAKATSTEVKYVQVPYDAAKQAFLGLGFPEWQVDGIMELFQGIDNGDAVGNEENDHFYQITGKQPKSVQEWVEENAAAFQ